jgi:glycerophosphoryl diester phosphodiesterase
VAGSAGDALAGDFTYPCARERRFNSTAEIRAFLDAGVDGVLADQPDTAVAARDDWLAVISVG